MESVQPATIRKDSLLTTTWALTGAAVAFFLVRLAIRKKFTGKIWLDDWISGAATGFLFAQSLITTLMADSMYETLRYSNTRSKLRAGMTSFYRRQSFSPSIQTYMRSQFAQMICFWTCIWLVKASFLTLSFRLLPSHLRLFTIAWCTITGLTALFYVISIITFPIACSALSPPFCSGGHSINLSQVSLQLSSALDIITNILIIALPIALAFRANLPTRTKIVLVAIFSSITLIIIMSIVRLKKSEGNESDWPEVTALNFWSAIEAGTALIIVNVVEFKLLFTINQASRPQSQYPPLTKERGSTLPPTVRNSILSPLPRVQSHQGQSSPFAMTPRDPRERVSIMPYRRPSPINVPYKPDPGPATYSPPVLSDVSNPAIRTHLEPPSSSIGDGTPSRRWSDASSHGGMQEVIIGHELDDLQSDVMARDSMLAAPEEPRVSRDSRLSRASRVSRYATPMKEEDVQRQQSRPQSQPQSRVHSQQAHRSDRISSLREFAREQQPRHSADGGEHSHLHYQDHDLDEAEDDDDDSENHDLVIQGGDSDPVQQHDEHVDHDDDESDAGLENYDLGGLSYYLPATPEAPRASFYNL